MTVGDGSRWRELTHPDALPERLEPPADACGSRLIMGHCFGLPCDECSDGGCCSDTCRCTYCTADERELAGRRQHSPGPAD